jgi:hypothetical protein
MCPGCCRYPQLEKRRTRCLRVLEPEPELVPVLVPERALELEHYGYGVYADPPPTPNRLLTLTQPRRIVLRCPQSPPFL